ncbi:S8 family serine peptidase [Gottfriedia sp. NPDC057948]|uniref:S8 family serine peptidase n=1 Tax=Gottfriedia sp. NPDC057948 TaxID=3346287 RepID=UPI0036D8DC17
MKKKRKISKHTGIAIFAALLLSSVPLITHANTSSEASQNDSVQQIKTGNVDEQQNQDPVLSSFKNGETRTITLITGDVVTITGVGDGKTTIDITTANGEEDHTNIMTINKETFVIPEQAMPYLAADKLDNDLFNISKLLKNEYDDANQNTMPLIVQYKKSKTRAMTTDSIPEAPEGSTQTHILESINAVSLTTKKSKANDFWKSVKSGINTKSSKTKMTNEQVENGIDKIWLDGKVEATLDKSVPQVGAPTAWSSGFDGTGTKVAVLDTGIDKDHPDILGQLDEAVSFVPGEDTRDYNSHGTHVASTVLGTGAASGGKLKGVAPGSHLLVGKVLANNGSGQDSWVIEGMEWAAHHAKVVSMSLSSQEASDGKDPMSQAVNRLSKETGALFVIAAGNRGGEGTIGSPGAADAAITIGAVSKTDQLASFSSKGPRIGDFALKPDLSAPGVDIVAARSQYASSGSGYYSSKSGTSMATPHVAGAAAIISQRHPEWTGQQIKDALMSSTVQLKGLNPTQYGTGRLDIPAALGNIRSTGSVSFGFFDWPHEEKTPVERNVTYYNDSDKDVILDLSISFTDANGQPAPNGLIKQSADKVTVPAKGNATVQLSVDVSKGTLGATYQGQLSARLDGKIVTHTAMNMTKESERYNLTINAIDRDGSPNVAYPYVYNLETGTYQQVAVNGTKTLRLPPGTYSIMSIMDVDKKTDHLGVALVGNPEFELKEDSTLDLDGQKANEIKVKTPKESESSFRKMEYTRLTANGGIAQMLQLPNTVDNVYVAPINEVKSGSFETATRWRMVKPILTMKYNGIELDDFPQLGSTNLDGTYQLDTVYAEKGAAEDYNGLDAKGKAVIIKRSDEVDEFDRAKAAIAAGVKLLIVVNDKPQELIEPYATNAYAKIPLAVTAISGTEGEKLIAEVQSNDLKLNVKGTANTPYLYDLVKAFNGSIPDNEIVYAPEVSDLARVDSRYYSDRKAPGAEWRFDFRPTRSLDRRLAWEPMSFPIEREEWVSATEGSTWYQKASVTDNEWEMRDEVVKYNPGEHLESNWFKPVVRPSFGTGFFAPYREGNFIYLNTPAWGDGEFGHAGFLAGTIDDTTSSLYQGTTLIRQMKGASLNTNKSIPQERTQYKLIEDSQRDPARWHTSTQTHTEWTFWSEFEAKRVTMPLLALNYDIDTNLAGDVKAGSSTRLKVYASHIDGAKGAGHIEGTTLEVSFDRGKTWEAVTLTSEESGWVTKLKLPKLPGGSVSLRASAWDDAGNRIKQDVIDAFGLR